LKIGPLLFNFNTVSILPYYLLPYYFNFWFLFGRRTVDAALAARFAWRRPEGHYLRGQ